METKVLTGYCPNCFTKLDYEENEAVVQCPACDANVRVANLVASLDANYGTSKQMVQNEDNSLFVSQIETAESGLAYLENFFENFDWEEYNNTSTIEIKAIKQMVEKNKIKNAANPQTWLLEFKSIYTLLTKKIEGLDDLANKIASVYDAFDETNALTFYDAYREVVKSLINNKEEMLKRLALDVKYAEKYKLGNADVSAMKQQLTDVTAKYENIVLYDCLKAVPAVAEEIENKEQQLIKDLAKAGINAEQVYNAAVKGYLENEDKLEVLSKFQSVKGYKDANKYIYKINRLFNYNNELFDIGGKSFTTQKESQTLLDVENLGEGEDELTSSQKGTTFALYEVNSDGNAMEKPEVTGISYIICQYASYLYFIKNNSQLCRYNTVSHTTDVIDKARPNDYKDINGKYSFFFTKEGNKFFLRKKLEVKMLTPGCFASLFGKKAKQIEDNNNYSVILVDLTSGTTETIIEEVIDIMDYFDDKLFYTYSPDPNVDSAQFMTYDLSTGTKSNILDANCLIHSVYENKVIYSLFEPNYYNLSLHVYDINNNIDMLLENNIYDFFDIIDGKVYYTIGNDDYCPLYCIDFDGSNRHEILRSVEKVCLVNAGWMYVIKGYGRNKVLYKISTNGEKRVFLCSRVSKFVKYTSGYLYYVDVNSALHVVRNDGTNDKVLVEGVDEKRVIIDEDYIYYLRYENVNSRKKNYSLYRAKHDGSDTKKLAFDVLGIMPYDENTIYISKSELVTYEVKTPISKKEVSTEIQTYNIKNYYSFDKDSCKFNLILSLGNPKAHEFEFKGGCLRKTKKLNSTYKQIPNKAEYKRGGKAEAGANFKEEQNVLLTQNMGNNTTKKNKVVNNAKKGINGGCGCLKRS